MTARVVFGVRPDGAAGLFVSPPGVDALTADPTQLTLNVTQFIDQIIMRGVASGLPQVVALGLSAAPIVLLTQTVQDLYFWNGTETTFITRAHIRPYPNLYDFSNCIAAVSAASMTISGAAASCAYSVFRRAGS